jgi:hypothetical protein
MKILAISSVVNPLAWFESLIIADGYVLLHKEFKVHAKEQGGYFLPAHPYNGLTDESVYFIDIISYEDMNMIGYTFESYAGDRVSNEYGVAILNFNKRLTEIAGEKEVERFLALTVASIKSYQEVTQKKKKFNGKDYLNKVLNDLMEYVQYQVSNTQVDQSGDSVNTIFGFKKGTRTIRLLYECLVSIEFFDESIDQSELFFNILTMPEIDHGHPKIKVSCSVEKAAYIFRRLEPLFNNLSFRSIEQTGAFINRLNQPFKESGLSKALHFFLEKVKLNSELISDIDNMIRKLLPA